MRRVLTVLLLVALSAEAHAQMAPLDLHAFQNQTASLFDPQFLSDPNLEFTRACQHVLVMLQAVSVLLIIGGMLVKIRSKHAQMEGIASVILKVAFIATISVWSARTLETADAVAAEIGYQPVATINTPPSAMTRMWNFAGQWLPPSTPYLDAIEAQDSANAPASGAEDAWAQRAWNWARGVGTTTSNAFDASWQALSGSVRGAMVHTCCACMSCIVLFSIVLTYAAEVLRYFIFYAGGALLPVAIAGLSVDALRNQSLKFILWLASVACWPIGWALSGIVSSVLLQRIAAWMTAFTASALAIPQGTVAPPIAVAAPFLAWGVLLLFAVMTVVLCVWWLSALLGVPFLTGKLLTSGAAVVGGFVQHGVSQWPAARPSAAARSPGKIESAAVRQIEVNTAATSIHSLAARSPALSRSAISPIRTYHSIGSSTLAARSMSGPNVDAARDQITAPQWLRARRYGSRS